MTYVRRAPFVVALALWTGAAALGVHDVSKDEERRWLRWVIPLPKEIEINRKTVVPAGAVTVTLRQGAGEAEETAAKELRALLQDKGKAGDVETRFDIAMRSF